MGTKKILKISCVFHRYISILILLILIYFILFRIIFILDHNNIKNLWLFL